MKTFWDFIALFSCLLMSCCGPQIHDETEVSAKAVDTYLENETLGQRPHLKIKNAGFNQDFMFYGTFIPMLKSPSGHSLKGRIVRFEKMADRVILLESPAGHSIADGSSSTILLAEFPIVRSDAEGTVIDFAKGMNNVFITRNVHASSAGNPNVNSSGQFRSVALTASYIKAITTEQDTLTITQIAQWKNAKAELVSAEFRYYFREYAPAPDFIKKSLGPSRRGQYFSTPPQVKPPTTEPWEFITKWHTKRPIIFYVSHNTPSDYRQAIKDGLLFWNHIFGREIIQVEDLKPGLSAPHPRLNIVQWVPWDNQASAYADMVVDHLTGETMQAQIYIRSGWVFGSPRKLRTELQKLMLAEPGEESLAGLEEEAPMPSMFDRSELCDQSLKAPEALADLADFITASQISDSTIKTITADIIRSVVAHELGHVLGLRHNLASSTAGNVGLSERASALKTYLSTGRSVLKPDQYLTRSIMDVFSAADDGLLGSQIRELIQDQDLGTSKLPQIYLYDKELIDYGYFDKAMTSNTPFCTDEDIKSYLDCRRWDVTPTPVLFAAAKLNGTLTQVAMLLAETFMGAIDPERKGGPILIRDLPFGSGNVMKNMRAGVIDLFSWFNRDTRSIQIEAQFAALGPHNRAQINKARFDSVRDQLNAQGVNDTLFALMPPYCLDRLKPDQLVHAFSAQLARLIRELKAKHPHLQLSDSEWQEAQSIARDFFTVLSSDIVTMFANTLSRMHFDDPNFQLPLEEAIGTIARELILASNQNLDAPRTNHLPVFTYDLATREAGALMLNPGMGILADWSFDTMRLVSDDLKNIMRRHGATDGATNIDLNSISRQKRQWLLEQNRVLNALARAKSMQRPIGEIPREQSAVPGPGTSSPGGSAPESNLVAE